MSDIRTVYKAAHEDFAAKKYQSCLYSLRTHFEASSSPDSISVHIETDQPDAETAQATRDAQFLLGFMYDEGLGASFNTQRAERWYLKAAEGGHIHAMTNLAAIYLKSPDKTKLAHKWYSEAAHLGDTTAMVALGLMYKFGALGEFQSRAIARALFTDASSRGCMRGCFHLGLLLYEDEEYDAAKKMFEVAAEKGDRNSMTNLGVIYGNGQASTPKDLEAAKFWFEKAGMPHAVKQLQVLKNEIKQD